MLYSNRRHFLSVYQRSNRFQMLGNNSKKKKKINDLQLGITNFSGVLSTTHVGFLASKLIGKAMNKGGRFLRNCGAASVGEYNRVIQYYKQS